MKVHKITKERIYFQMDSGAYGSASKEDILKLQFCSGLPPEKYPEIKIDARKDGCIVDTIFNTEYSWWRKNNEVQR